MGIIVAHPSSARRAHPTGAYLNPMVWETSWTSLAHIRFPRTAPTDTSVDCSLTSVFPPMATLPADLILPVGVLPGRSTLYRFKNRLVCLDATVVAHCVA